MNRRDLLRGALTLSILGANQTWASICTNHGPCAAASDPYPVLLSGPFGLVLHRDISNPLVITGLTAFMPADPHNRHKFALQGAIQTISNKKFNFLLQQTSPPNSPVLCVDEEFSAFCIESTPWSAKAKAKLLTIDLAVPTRVTPILGDTPLSVVFQSSKPGKMYTALLLEYDLKISPLKLIHKDSGLNIPLSPDFLAFEVGLDRNDPDTPDIAHGRDFHNSSLLPFFPGLKGDPNHIVISAADNGIRILTTTFECKAGGIIVGNP